MTDLRSRVVSGLKWQATAKVGSQIISWSVTIYVMRLLAPADYGLMAMTMVLVGLSALVAEMGFGAALIRAPVADLPLQRSVFGFALITNLVLYALLVAAAPLAVWHFSEPRLALLTLVLGLQLPIATLGVVPEAMARRDLRFKPLSIIELAVQVTTVLATLAAALSGLGVWALVVGQFTQTVVRSGSMALMFGMVAPSFRIRGQLSLIAFGGSLTLNRIVWFITTQADIFIVGKILGPQLLGIYSVALNLASMPMSKIMSVTNQVAYSAFSKLQGDRAAFRTGLLSTTRITFVFSIPLLWCMAAVAPELILLLLGEKWQASIYPFQIIAVAIPLRIFCTQMSTALLASGNVNDDLKNTLTSASILIPAFAVGAWSLGIIGVALAWLLAYPIYAIFMLRRISARIGVGLQDAIGVSLPVVLSGLAMWAAVWTARNSLPTHPVAIGLVTLTGVAAVAFLLTLLAIDGDTRRWVVEALKRRRPPPQGS